MLGEFLEISLRCDDILASIAFYEKLGFVQAQVNDIWSHPYAVLTDGRCVLGLHKYDFPAPSLTFVSAQLARRVTELETRGITFAFQKLGPEQFNEAGFYTPDRQMVCLLEARTFSPPHAPDARMLLSGHYAGLRLPVENAVAACAYWETLGFIVETRTAACNGLTLLCDEDPRLRAPELIFHTSGDVGDRLVVAQVPFVRRGNTILLTAPEGTLLVLENQA